MLTHPQTLRKHLPPPQCAARRDEQHNLSFGRLHLFEHSLEPFFKFALNLAPASSAPMSRATTFGGFSGIGHIPFHDTLGQAFHNGGLTHRARRYTGLSCGDGTDLTMRRISSSCRSPDPACRCGPVGRDPAVFLFQGLISFFRIRVGHAPQPRMSFNTDKMASLVTPWRVKISPALPSGSRSKPATDVPG